MWLRKNSHNEYEWAPIKTTFSFAVTDLRSFDRSLFFIPLSSLCVYCNGALMKFCLGSLERKMSLDLTPVFIVHLSPKMHTLVLDGQGLSHAIHPSNPKLPPEHVHHYPNVSMSPPVFACISGGRLGSLVSIHAIWKKCKNVFCLSSVMY